MVAKFLVVSWIRLYDVIYFFKYHIFSVDDGIYSQVSIENAKNFLAYCKKALGDNPFLWIAFQSNCFKDRCQTSHDFESECEEMMEFVRNGLKFYSPNLTLNMRNSREIGKLAKTMKTGNIYESEIINILQSLPTPNSSITAQIPTLFAIPEVDLEEKYFNIFKTATATEIGKINVILIDGENYFDVEKIKEALVKCDINEEDIFDHTFKSNKPKEKIQQFLKKKNGFLICEAELFTGMEADSVVYCVSDSNYDNQNIRVNVMRACSRLNIVYAYDKDDSDYIDFSGANVDDDFMNGCDEEMKYFAFKCLKCEKKERKFGADIEDEDDLVVCKSCIIRCHSGHEIEVLNIRDGLKKDFCEM